MGKDRANIRLLLESGLQDCREFRLLHRKAQNERERLEEAMLQIKRAVEGIISPEPQLVEPVRPCSSTLGSPFVPSSPSAAPSAAPGAELHAALAAQLDLERVVVEASAAQAN